MTDTDDKPEIKGLDILMKDYPPLLRGRKPRWYPEKQPDCWRSVRVPDFAWKRDGYDEIDPAELLTLDVNAAFLSPVSSTEIAHDPLEHTGPKFFDNWPGYWLIDNHRWPSDQIVTPLGNTGFPTGGSANSPTAWYPTPTVKHLIQLQDEGLWPDFKVYDSWTCETKTRARDWASYMRDMRAEAHACRSEDPQYYEAVKLGYSVPIQMMLGPKPGEKFKSGILRPDWNHAFRAAHAANMWRKAWWLNSIGIPVMAMKNRDTITIWQEDYPILLKRIANDPKAKIKIDESGLQLGAFKIKVDDQPEEAAA